LWKLTGLVFGPFAGFGRIAGLPTQAQGQKRREESCWIHGPAVLSGCFTSVIFLASESVPRLRATFLIQNPKTTFAPERKCFRRQPRVLTIRRRSQRKKLDLHDFAFSVS